MAAYWNGSHWVPIPVPEWGDEPELELVEIAPLKKRREERPPVYVGSRGKVRVRGN